MHPDGCDHLVALGVDHADVVGAGVHHVDFILLAVGCDAGGIGSHRQSLGRLEGAQVDDADRVALAVGDVGVFAIGGAVVGQRALLEIPPAEAAPNHKQQYRKKKFSHASRAGAVVHLYSGQRHMIPHPRHRAPHHSRDLPDLRHQLIELIGEDRLRPVRQRFIRLMVNLDDESVGADGDGSAGERRDFVAFAGALAGIDNDRQMAEPLHRRNHAQIEGIAGMVGEGADAALAQQHVVVAFAHHVLGRHQEFFQGRRHAALHHHRNLGPSGTLQQRIVLHVAGANLDDVGVFFHQIHGLVVDGLGDDLQTKAVAHLRHDAQAFFSQTLKGIGRSARLVGASAKKLRARLAHAFGYRKGLLVAFNRTGSRP